ncbi:hypothetical protein WN55_03517 [Dufourea novaeangliae]|uniref:Uncharacterized protein n=1 Tax=Dufourea novaeangliae TaxID=178035 RepID=A0A154PJJ3_DUFNO|nr:hypothetical protein WN55_03517 [Dufourea novaeangliae]
MNRRVQRRRVYQGRFTEMATYPEVSSPRVAQSSDKCFTTIDLPSVLKSCVPPRVAPCAKNGQGPKAVDGQRNTVNRSTFPGVYNTYKRFCLYDDGTTFKTSPP